MTLARYDVQLDDDGDLPATGALHTSRTKLAAQRIEQSLNLWLGEWFMDEAKGVPWAAWMEASGAPTVAIQAFVRRLVAGVPDVTRVESVVVTLDEATRRVLITISAFVVDDALTVAGVLDLTAPNVHVDFLATPAAAPIWGAA